MSIFGTIMNKIFHHGQPAPAASAPAAPAITDVNAAAMTAANEAMSAAQEASAAAASAAAAPAVPAQPVDVEAVLSGIAAQKGQSLNWQSSIVDLLKLLDMDSSLGARKELANELNLHVAADGSAEENIALHKAVMQKLAENGGKVPDSLRG